METMLTFVTGIAVAVALAAAFAAWQVRAREEARRRARVAALSAAIQPPLEPLTVEVQLEGVATGGMSGMFASASDSRPAASPGFTALAFAAGAAMLLIGAVLIGSRPDARAAEVPAAPAPLELLALRHEQQVDALTVSGTVRNPAAAAPVRNVTAVVFFFDQSGGFLGSSRAPVDITTLAPGEDSPFTVTVKPAPQAATRYRVSFRQDDSGLLPHVDRREKA